MRGSVISAGLGLGDGGTGPRGVSVGHFKQRRGQPAASRLPGPEEDCATSSTGTNYWAPASADRACRERQALSNGPLAHASAGTGSSAGSVLSPGGGGRSCICAADACSV